MSEEQKAAARAVTEATKELNRATRRARDLGLEVRASTLSIPTMDQPRDELVSVRVSLLVAEV